MTLRAAENLLAPEETAASLAFLAQDLLDALG